MFEMEENEKFFSIILPFIIGYLKKNFFLWSMIMIIIIIHIIKTWNNFDFFLFNFYDETQIFLFFSSRKKKQKSRKSEILIHKPSTINNHSNVSYKLKCLNHIYKTLVLFCDGVDHQSASEWSFSWTAAYTYIHTYTDTDKPFADIFCTRRFFIDNDDDDDG